MLNTVKHLMAKSQQIQRKITFKQENHLSISCYNFSDDINQFSNDDQLTLYRNVVVKMKISLLYHDSRDFDIHKMTWRYLLKLAVDWKYEIRLELLSI